MSQPTIYEQVKLTYQPARNEEVTAQWGSGDFDEVIARRQANDNEGRAMWSIELGGTDFEERVLVKADRYTVERIVCRFAEAFAALEREQTGAML